MARYAPNPEDLLLAVCPKGTVLKNPGEADEWAASAGDYMPSIRPDLSETTWRELKAGG